MSLRDVVEDDDENLEPGGKQASYTIARFGDSVNDISDGFHLHNHSQDISRDCFCCPITVMT
jgi:hypothetical protein